jgi:thioredoxin-like negative regulator of GroEL
VRAHQTSLLAVVAVALTLAFAAGAGTAGAQIRWETKFDRARDTARESRQPVLIEFWATWCVPCAEMDRDVYADQRVASAMAKVRPVRIDIDREPGFARKYGVTATPTLLLTDAFGNELFRYLGALSLDRMLHLLEALPADITHINELGAALAKDQDDFAALEGLGRELRADALYRSSNEYFARALRTRDGKRPTDQRAAILVDMARNAVELKAWPGVSRGFEQALREFPGRAWEPEAMLGLGRALLEQDRTASAQKVLRDLIARHAGSPAAADAARLLASR